MKIGIDVRYLSHGLVSGIHTFMENLIPAVLTEATSTGREVVLYADTKRPFDIPMPPTPSVTLRQLPYRSALSAVRHDLLMGRDMARDDLDVYHFAGNYGYGPKNATIVTLQDEINLMSLAEIWRGHAKRVKTLGMMTYLHFCTQAAVRRADMVITISEYSKRRIAMVGSTQTKSPSCRMAARPMSHASPTRPCMLTLGRVWVLRGLSSWPMRSRTQPSLCAHGRHCRKLCVMLTRLSSSRARPPCCPWCMRPSTRVGPNFLSGQHEPTYRRCSAWPRRLYSRRGSKGLAYRWSRR